MTSKRSSQINEPEQCYSNQLQARKGFLTLVDPVGWPERDTKQKQFELGVPGSVRSPDITGAYEVGESQGDQAEAQHACGNARQVCGADHQ